MTTQLTASEIQGDYQFNALYHGSSVQRAWHRAKLKIIRQIAPPPRGGLVLDAGCGSGVISAFLAALGARVKAVDSNLDAIRFARDVYSIPRVEFIHASLLTYQGGPFDAIYCIEVIEHLPPNRLTPLLRRFGDLLAPGGRLFITTPNYRSAWPLIELGLDLLKLTPRLRGDQHLCPMTPGRLRRAMKTARLSLLKMGSFNGLAPFLAFLPPGVFARVERWESRRGALPAGNLLYALCKSERNSRLLSSH
ncbi:MAG: class I SAM-dependent methyltransferase [Desulfobacterales bacterium]|nr:class I SAM-dependent methyltransferase [Desulfobacterales bacterium]